MLRKIKNKSSVVSNRRKTRIRYKLKKGNTKPRLSVFLSNMHIYAQIIDDVRGVTLASASTKHKVLKDTIKKTSNKEAAIAVGKFVATTAIKAGVLEVVFDRGSKVYHGKVKALADAARENGLKF
jgi:large subunit ribosomal protein L18